MAKGFPSIGPKRTSAFGVNAFAKARSNFVGEMRRVAANAMNEQADEIVRQIYEESKGQKPVAVFSIGNSSRRKTKPQQNANAIKKLLIEFDHRPEVAEYALAQARLVKPNITGHYVDEFTLFIDGAEGLVSQIEFGDKIEIINKADYARMLEVGLRPGGAPFVVNGPLHLVERLTKEVVKRKFRKVCLVEFNYRDIPNPYTLRQDHPDRRGKVKPGKAFGDAIRYPAIILHGGTIK